MNIDWNLIKEKYPKGYKLFIEYLIKTKKLGGEIYFIEYLILELLNKNNNFICYCDLEKFFDLTEKIHIKSLYERYYKELANFYGNKYNRCLYGKDMIDIKNKAKEQAIYKAFEIMEEQLN